MYCILIGQLVEQRQIWVLVREVLATPLQVINLINFIANKGYIYSPHLIKNKDNVIRKDIELSPWIWTFLDNAIYNAVKEGTGKNADILNSDAIVRGKLGQLKTLKRRSFLVCRIRNI